MSQPIRILLVEDHADSAKLLARLLSREGHAVKIADSVQSAEQLAAAEAFDVLLCDLGLPDGSGLDLMREIGRRHGLKGIALTGGGLDEDEEQTREAGFSAHLIKPVNLPQLKAALERVAVAR